MLKGDGNENGIKINRSNLRICAARAGRRNCRMCFPKILFPLFMLGFIFSLPLVFTLLAASISHFFTAAMKFSCFFFSPKKFVSFDFNHSL